MKLRDLKFIDKSSPPDLQKAQSLLHRVQGFLESARASEPPTNFENPNDEDRHIELEIFVPRAENDSNLQLPLEELCYTDSSDSSSDDASDCESEEKLLTDPLVREINPSEEDNNSFTFDVNNTFGNSLEANRSHFASAIQKTFDGVLSADRVKGLFENIEESSSLSSGCSGSDTTAGTYLDTVIEELESKTSKSPTRSLIEEMESDCQCKGALVENESGQKSLPDVEVEDGGGCSKFCSSSLISLLTFPDIPIKEISKASKHPLIEEIPTSEQTDVDNVLVPSSKRSKVENIMDDADA